MTKALEEMKRVSKKGTNEIQTKGVRLESRIIEIAKEQNLCLNLKMSKPIRGLQNSMKDESILFFKNLK